MRRSKSFRRALISIRRTRREWTLISSISLLATASSGNSVNRGRRGIPRATRHRGHDKREVRERGTGGLGVSEVLAIAPAHLPSGLEHRDEDRGRRAEDWGRGVIKVRDHRVWARSL